MSLHSYSRVWLHLVWATIERRALLQKPAAAKLSSDLHEYAQNKGIYMKINFVNPDHVHALVDLPTSLCIEDMMHFLKGGSSHWINENNLVAGKIVWRGGYGGFSGLPPWGAAVAGDNATQEQHPRKSDLLDGIKTLVMRY